MRVVNWYSVWSASAMQRPLTPLEPQMPANWSSCASSIDRVRVRMGSETQLVGIRRLRVRARRLCCHQA